MSARSGTREGERGATMVEFALTALLFLTLVFGVIGFGQALSTYDLVANAARVGSRYAMVRGSACPAADCPATATSIQTYVRSKSVGINTANLSVTPTYQADAAAGCTTAANSPGCIVDVTVSYPAVKFNLIPKYSFTFTSSSQMLISQ